MTVSWLFLRAPLARLALCARQLGAPSRPPCAHALPFLGTGKGTLRGGRQPITSSFRLGKGRAPFPWSWSSPLWILQGNEPHPLLSAGIPAMLS